MRFLIDAQLPPALAERLRERGHEADHVNRIGLSGAADADIWTVAKHTGAVLVTKDEDFVALARRDPEPAQVLWIRLGNVTNAGLRQALEPKLAEILAALDAGEPVIEVRSG